MLAFVPRLALALSFLLAGFAGSHAAPVEKPPHQGPRPDVRVQIAHAPPFWDGDIDNAFPWLFANPKITTACNIGVGDFNAKVALVDCRWSFKKKRERGYSLEFAALGGGGGGQSVRDEGVGSSPSSDLTPVPLPGAVVLFGSAIAAVGWLRRRKA